MKNKLLYFLFIPFFCLSCGGEMEVPSEEDETTSLPVNNEIDSVINEEIISEIPSTPKKWVFEYIKDKSTQIRPTRVVFEMNDSIAIFKKVGNETNPYNTFYIRSNGVSITSTKESIIHKIDLLFFPGLHSALPEHHGIRIIPIVIAFDSDYNPISLKVQNCTYYTEIQGNKAEEYTEYHPEVRSKKRRIDLSPIPPREDQHLVKNGDTHYSISNKYGITITELLKLNPGLTIDSPLFIGEKLTIKK